MRHGRSRGRLSLVQEHRRALLRNLARALITHQQIVTTHDRAKETSRFVDRLVTIAKAPSLHSRRELIRKLGSGSEMLAQRLLETVAPKFSERNGGYTRVLRYKDRAGDGAALSLLEFSAPIEIIPKKVRKKKPPKPAVKEELKEKAQEAKPEAPKKGGFISSLRRFFLGGDHEKK